MDTTTRSQLLESDERAERPRFAIGHVGLSAGDVATLTDFYVDVGMRSVVSFDHMAIVELLGGTHIIFSAGESGGQHLDLIVDDIDETHAVLAAAGASPSEIRRGSPHDTFSATDPEGNRLTVHSTHAIGPV